VNYIPGCITMGLSRVRLAIQLFDQLLTNQYIIGNFLLLRPQYRLSTAMWHVPKVPVTLKYIVLQRVLQKRECMSILKLRIQTNMHLISNGKMVY
jgi:cytochrome c-type biogenesis protein CcmH/NrfF